MTVEVLLNGVPVPIVLDDDALTTIAAALPQTVEPPSPYLSIVEAAAYLRTSRQRVDDLLSARKLTRCKDGARTLIERAELDAYLQRDERKRQR